MAFRRNDPQFTLVRSGTCDLSVGGGISESLQTGHSIRFLPLCPPPPPSTPLRPVIRRKVQRVKLSKAQGGAAPPGGHFTAVAQRAENGVL